MAFFESESMYELLYDALNLLQEQIHLHLAIHKQTNYFLQ